MFKDGDLANVLQTPVKTTQLKRSGSDAQLSITKDGITEI